MAARDLADYDDIHLKSNDLSHVEGPTVISLAHNEMYFLPAWLAHYRKLGARRFIILDDASTDGTLDYLSAQPDVMVMGSGRRFGDVVRVIDRADPDGSTTVERRMNHLWRMILAERYCIERWFVLADLDEFLVLPEGLGLAEVVRQLEPTPFDCVCGTMLDSYPRDMRALRGLRSGTGLDLGGEWYFDAEPHRSPEAIGTTKVAYHGARARLVHEFLTVPSRPWRERLRHWRQARRGQVRYPKINDLNKFALLRWRPGAWMSSAHRISLDASSQHHLPILHMKFTGDLYRRAQVAIRDKSYHNGSAEYVQMVELLDAMERRNGSFLYSHSAPITDIEAFRRVGLLAGF